MGGGRWLARVGTRDAGVGAGIVLIGRGWMQRWCPRYAARRVDAGANWLAVGCKGLSSRELVAALGCSKRSSGVGGVASKPALDKLEQVDETVARSGDQLSSPGLAALDRQPYPEP